MIYFKKKLKKYFFLMSINYTITKNYNYDDVYFNLSKKLQIDTGVVVFAYNRPAYFKQVINSLAANPEAQTLPFIFILDGGPEATQEENSAIINQANIKHTFIIKHNSNYGCGRTLIDGRRFMFEWCKFKKIIFFEDDLIVSPHYISLILKLYKWSKKYYANVGLVGCFNRCFLAEKNKLKKLNTVLETFAGYWGYCMDKDAYNKIKDILNEHELYNLLPFSASNPNAFALAYWFQKIISQPNTILKKENVIVSTVDWHTFFNTLLERFWSSPASHRTGQDFEMRLALWKAGLIKLTTLVSRAVYIGANGTSHNQNNYDLLGYNVHTNIRYNKDSNIQKFILHQPKKSNNKIVFDIRFLTPKKSFNPSIRRFIDTCIENGAKVFIKQQNHNTIKNQHYFLENYTSHDISSVVYTIIPIRSNNDLQVFLKESSNQKNSFLFLTTTKPIKKKFLSTILRKVAGIITLNQEIHDELLDVCQPNFLFTWHSFLQKKLT